MFLGFEVLVGVFGGVLIATIVVLVMQIRTTSQVSKMTFPAYEYAIKKAEHDGESIIADAQKKAREIVANAEKAAQDTVAVYDTQANTIHEHFHAVLKRQTEEMTEALKGANGEQLQSLQQVAAAAEQAITSEQRKIADTVARTNKTLESTAARSEQHTTQSLQNLEKDIRQIGTELKAQLESAERASLEQVKAHLEILHKEAEEHIAAYEESRKHLMDRHIEQLVGAVVTEILHTQLPMKEHVSLARKALEDAKARHIL